MASIVALQGCKGILFCDNQEVKKNDNKNKLECY